MKELNNEINLTIDMIQADHCDEVRGELQGHLYYLLEIKRNELQRRLLERCRSEPVTPEHHPAEQQLSTDVSESKTPTPNFTWVDTRVSPVNSFFKTWVGHPLGYY